MESFIQLPQQFKNKNNEVPVFAFMGEFDCKSFGLDIILKAFSDYKNKYLENGSLWLIGEGKDQELLSSLIVDYHISDFVKIKPIPIGRAKFDLLHQVDLFLRPSRNEYFPSSVLEAASVAVPSIVTGNFQISQYIQNYNAGYVLEENNYKQLAKLMLKCLQDIKYNNWNVKRRNSLRMVNEQFYWNKIAAAHQNLFEQTI